MCVSRVYSGLIALLEYFDLDKDFSIFKKQCKFSITNTLPSTYSSCMIYCQTQDSLFFYRYINPRRIYVFQAKNF